MNLTTIIIIAIILIIADKGLTILNINAVNKNFPESQTVANGKYSIEKNPIAKWFFVKFGLYWGSLLMSLVSILQMFIAYWLLSRSLSPGIALYVIFMFYGIVILNNTYFLLKYSKIIN